MGLFPPPPPPERNTLYVLLQELSRNSVGKLTSGALLCGPSAPNFGHWVKTGCGARSCRTLDLAFGLGTFNSVLPNTFPQHAGPPNSCQAIVAASANASVNSSDSSATVSAYCHLIGIAQVIVLPSAIAVSATVEFLKMAMAAA